jgi:hypothetical protein
MLVQHSKDWYSIYFEYTNNQALMNGGYKREKEKEADS